MVLPRSTTLLVLASAARLAAASEASASDGTATTTADGWNGHYYDVSEESLDVLRSMPGEAQRTWLVQFYTPWCGRCRKFHDAWSELAAATPGQRSADAELRLARLDAAASPAVIARFGLRGFPAFLLFDGAQFRRYRGELSLAGLQSFVGSGGGSAHPEAVREASAEFAPTTFRADEQTDRQLMTELGPRRAPASPALARSHADGPPASPRRTLARVGLLHARHPARLLLQPAPLRLRALVRPVRPRSSEAGGGKERGQKEEIRLSLLPRCRRHPAVCLRLMAFNYAPHGATAPRRVFPDHVITASFPVP